LFHKVIEPGSHHSPHSFNLKGICPNLVVTLVKNQIRKIAIICGYFLNYLGERSSYASPIEL